MAGNDRSHEVLARMNEALEELQDRRTELQREIRMLINDIASMEEELRHCRCGAYPWDDGCPLTDVKVVVAYGEEGHAEETRFFCNDCLAELTSVLNSWGFIGSGVHSSIDLLMPQ